MPEVTLTTGGVTVGGWLSVSIQKSIDSLADDFTLEAANHRVSEGPGGRMVSDLSSADEVVLAIDGQTVLTGYIDGHEIDFDAQRSSLRLTGSSRVVDLVDASAERASGAWKQATLLDIASDLCLPLSITVVDAEGVSGAPLKRFRIEKGESIYEAISRAAEMRGVIVTCNADGNLELIQASSTPTGITLERGVNVYAGGCSRTTRGRHSVYKFKGQTAASDNQSGLKAAQLKGEVTDADVGRYRPLVVLSPKQKSSEDLGARAVWERNVRAGRSLRYRCSVEEWTASTGALWAPNMLVRVKDSWCGLDEDLLVVSVDFTLNNTERTTHLDLMPRVAYTPEPNAFKPKSTAAVSLANSRDPNLAFAGNLFGVGRVGRTL
jgi:prophage tail gpP-like protein